MDGERAATMEGTGHDTARAGAPELSVIAPTFNERGNIEVLFERLQAVLHGVAWEAIVVDDDSPDGTAAVAREIGARDSRMRCIRRIGRRGLSGACLEGMLASQARFVAVIDADLQHDATLLTAMLDTLRRDAADLTVGTRYSEGGSAGGFSASRERASRSATWLTQRVLGPSLSDPMSGFFMLPRTRIEAIASRLSTQGFKILLDIVMTAPGPLRIAEFPYAFGRREQGESKTDLRVGIEFLGLLLAKASNDVVSSRFIFFCVVGAAGVGVHVAALAVCHTALGIGFGWSQAIATMVAIASNFAMNNALTYRDQRLTGRRWFTGLLRFYVVSAIGAVSNVGVGQWIFAEEPIWWLAGLGGAVMGVVWNYVVASLFVWRTR